ncbi:acyltransferase family protein [Chryseobacterium sp. T16E-39]|uniref:acyltransferase family protein n=1 Tax=Chryseobacterium sp. T16E-39 TaxID=2015076 RepID=UPI0012F83A1F|nr:acyltransferase [Chryseobacterium sp. T16E-39]
MKKKLNLINVLNPYSLFSKELNTDRIFGLDILRAFAIIVVIMDHGKFMFPRKIVELHQYVQFDGVTVFFVLSGLLIGKILIKQMEHDKVSFRLLLDFWIRRWFRTLPTYFLILSVVMVCYSIKDASFAFVKMSRYYFFCQNFFHISHLYFPEAWSLSVEEWFYFMIPALIFLFILVFKLKPKISILIVVFIVLCSVTFLRYTIFLDHDEEKARTFHHIVIFRLDSIMYGVIGAYINYYCLKYWNLIPGYLFLAGIGIFVLQKYFSLNNIFPDLTGAYKVIFEFSLTSLGTLMLLPYLTTLKNRKCNMGKIITIISILSYSMYLTHMTLIKDMILYSIPWTSFTTNYNIIIPVMYSLYWGITLLLSIIIYQFYESPMTRLRDQFSLVQRPEKATT